MKTIIYWYDDQFEMIYFDNGHQSLVANGGYFFWKIDGKSIFFHEDMVDLQNKTGYIFKHRDS